MIMRAENGKIIDQLDTDFVGWIWDIAPDLVSVYHTLMPFSSLFCSMTAGPQKSEAKADAVPQYLLLQVDDPRHKGGDSELWVRITADKIWMEWTFKSALSKDQIFTDQQEITLGNLWAYLSQLPLPYHVFTEPTGCAVEQEDDE
jgi:hypothetical protein